MHKTVQSSSCNGTRILQVGILCTSATELAPMRRKNAIEELRGFSSSTVTEEARTTSASIASWLIFTTRSVSGGSSAEKGAPR